MLRKALLAVVLVSASFAGGAVVNGPGLQWAKAMVLSRLGAEGEGIDDVTNPAGPGAPGSPPEEIPARPIPPLVFDPVPAGKAAAKAKAETAGPADKAARREASPAPRVASRPPASDPPGLPGLAPVPEGSPALDPVPPLPPPSPSAPDREALAAAAAGATTTRPGAASVKRISLENPAEPAPAPTAGSGDWAEVRETMRSLGVSRYGVEGEPAGRVRFFCVIPVAGRRAVGQHFEAEGDDDLQAARAALRRVALWKATESSGNAP